MDVDLLRAAFAIRTFTVESLASLSNQVRYHPAPSAEPKSR